MPTTVSRRLATQLHKSSPAMRLRTFADSVKTVDAMKALGKPHTLWLAFAQVCVYKCVCVCVCVCACSCVICVLHVCCVCACVLLVCRARLLLCVVRALWLWALAVGTRTQDGVGVRGVA